MARVVYRLQFGTSPMHDHVGPIAFAAAADGSLVSEEIAEERAARLCTIPGFGPVVTEAATAAAPEPRPTIRRKGSAAAS
jgi:hypothetical protein